MSKENKSRKVTLRYSETQYASLSERAENASLSVSEYIRSISVNGRVLSRTDVKMLSELRKLGGLLKHIHNETRGAYSEDTANAIRALESYVRKLERGIADDRKTASEAP